MFKKTFFYWGFSGLLTLNACGESTGNKTAQNTQDTLTETTIESGPVHVEFESADSLIISANLYEVDPGYPMMVLCHQAKFCKYEYAGIAERFNTLGYNCLAIDQRSGGPIADQPNETWLRAVEQNKSTDYLEAEKDIVAAIDYAFKKSGQPVILVGSSYSSTLVIYQAIENEKVQAVISFSPGNYFAEQRGDLTQMMIKFEKPFFLTAAYDEMPFVRELVLGRQRTDNQIVFSPEGEGMHGARVLWPNQEGGEEYWAAIETFLEKLKNKNTTPEAL